MQGPIENALMLTAVGNAYLGGRDIAGFWPEARTFAFMKACEFRTPTASGEGEFPLAAADPLAWFASLKGGCRGLRLHFMDRQPEPGQMPGIAPRMLVGFVGGGPRWLVEVVKQDSSELWEGFTRLTDKDDPQRRIWTTTYIRQGEVRPEDVTPDTLEVALAELRGVLPEIEAYARSEDYGNFADCFARAREALDGPPAPNPWSDELVRYAGVGERQVRVANAAMEAWVFGGMGSWNDIGGGERYDTLSERLFGALCGAVCGLANSTYRG